METFLCKRRLTIPRYDSAFRVAFQHLRRRGFTWVNWALPKLESVIAMMVPASRWQARSAYSTQLLFGGFSHWRFEPITPALKRVWSTS